MQHDKTKWRTRITRVDIDTGEVISKYDTNNYQLIKYEKHAYIQNGNGNVELTEFYRRIYKSDLFDPDYYTTPD